MRSRTKKCSRQRRQLYLKSAQVCRSMRGKVETARFNSIQEIELPTSASTSKRATFSQLSLIAHPPVSLPVTALRNYQATHHTNNVISKTHQSTIAQPQNLEDKIPQNQGYNMATTRSFDGTSASVDVLNDLLQTYMPLRVDWTIGPTSCTFQLTGLTVQIDNRPGMTVIATSDIMPRRALDPLRQALREILQAALGEPSWSTLGFGVMLLQLG